MTGTTSDGHAASSANALPGPTVAGLSPDPQDADGTATPMSPMSPGDDALEGTPGTGENLCPRCNGSGRLASGSCPDCDGTGKVTTGIGGG